MSGTQAHQVDLFDRYAATYHAQHNRHYLGGRLAFILSRIEPRPGMRILEVGSGTGSITALLERRFPRATVCGIDFSEGMIRHRQFAHGVVADAEQLPFTDGGFDWIVASDIIEHVEHQERLVAECARCLKPGGRLLLTTPNPLFVPLLNFTGKIGLSLASEKLISLGAVKRAFAAHGLRLTAELRSNPAVGIVQAMATGRPIEAPPLHHPRRLPGWGCLTICYEAEKPGPRGA